MSEIRKNDIFTVKINEINNLGCGVGKTDDGIVVFVAGAVTGDSVEVKAIKVNKTYIVARLEKIIEPSAFRIPVAFCNASNSCGGCVYRHVTYEHELQMKRAYVESAFKKVGLSSVNVLPVISNGKTSGYRNKAQYPVRQSKRGIEAGFYAAKSHNIVPVDDCSLQPDIFGRILRFICKYAERNAISVYDETTGKGLLRHIYLRIAQGTGEIMVCLVINGDALPQASKFVGELTERFEKISSVMLNINKKNTNVVLGDKYICIGGKSYIEDILCSKRFEISAGSFYQVNHDMAQVLYRLAADLAVGAEKNEKPKTLLDLYCGTGTIGLSMADRAEKIIGIEIVEEAVECAKRNAAKNGIENAEFYCSDASDAKKLLDRAERENGEILADVAIIDPPRKGSTRELIEYLSERQIDRVVYVSCDCNTLARDCVMFAELGYSIGDVQPVDLFPRTGHVESVVCLSRK